ncbi:MAG: uncharacterized protein KVP18_002029 [Porospora cf. gigantea A]|nr:MAG: hypothetical protein KVP18_002029 [Porospora cf. gigantea A]
MAYGPGAFPSARLAARNGLNCLFVRDKPASLPTKLGVLFQPHLLMRNNRVNLGIVPGVESLTRNLRHWTEFCLQPRLHTPVLPLTPIPDELETALKSNRESLLKIALLLVSPRPSLPLVDLLQLIVGLGRIGNFSMREHEDAGELLEMAAAYLPLLTGFDGPKLSVSHTEGLQDLSSVVEGRIAELGHRAKSFLEGHHPLAFRPDTPEERRLRRLVQQVEVTLSPEWRFHDREGMLCPIRKMYDSLPEGFRDAAHSISARKRLRKLYSPLSLLDRRRLQFSLGGPLPFDRDIVFEVMQKLNRNSRRRLIYENLRNGRVSLQ